VVCRSARDVHQLEARIDSLAARNAKLMDTLKESLAVARLRRRSTGSANAKRLRRAARDPRGRHGDRVHLGRKMRLTCSPNIEVKELKQGQTCGSTRR